MASALQEDFSDVADFVQEDDEQEASEDEVERKIAEEHAKYKEAQAKRQEEVRASRPWSAPPVDSPRPEQQKERERERQARGSNPDAVVAAPRAEYEPPARPYLLQAQASGSNLSYLSRPQSAQEQRSSGRLMHGRSSRASLSGIEEETGEGSAANSRQMSDLGRVGSQLGEARLSSGVPAADAASRDPYGAIKEEEGEGEDADGEGDGADPEGTARALAEALAVVAAAAAEESSAAAVPGEEEDGEEEADGEEGREEKGEEEEEEDVRRQPEPRSEAVAEVAEEGEEPAAPDLPRMFDDDGVLIASAEGPLYGGQRTSWQRGGSSGGGGGAGSERVGDDAVSASRGSQFGGGKSGPASTTATPRSMAMRGFVEPLGYDKSQGNISGAGRASGSGDDDDGRDAGSGSSDENDDDEYDDDEYEDSFEDEEETDDTAAAEPGLASAEPSSAGAPSVRSRAASVAASMAAPSKEPSRSMSPPPPASYPSTPGGTSPGQTPPSRPPPKVEDWFPSYPNLSRSSIAASQRSISSSGAAASAAVSAAQPAAPPESDLLPPQQFALQLLKHDIDVLPQHHRAAAEAAAAARRKTSATARPAGAGLAAFGYLGYHIMPDDLTAPSGPGFRTGSPGRSSSPGRGTSAAGGPVLATTSSMKAARNAGGEEAAAGAGAGGAGRGGGRPISAPHMRPSGVSVDGGGGGGVIPVSKGTDGATGASNFLGTIRELRGGGGLLPPVAPTRPTRVSSAGSASGRVSATADGAAAATTTEVGRPRGPGSVSVLDDEEAKNVQESRIKFDVWLDSLAGGGKGAAAGGAHGGTADDHSARGTAAGAARRPPRPMTAPASGRRRPISARPGAGGTAAGAAGLYGVPAQGAPAPRPLARPVSAQPFSHGRPVSATYGGGSRTATGTGYEPSFGANGGVDTGMQLGGGGGNVAGEGALPPAPPPGGTAAVEVGGVTVSVYVADTLKRIVEANRWLQQLGAGSRRYQLKDRLSAMTVQLVEELPPLPSDSYEPYDNGTVAVVKELTLKQFLSGHAKLKQQAKKLRQATTPPLPPQQYGSMHGYVDGGAGRTLRPFSANPSGGGGRTRPVSAVPHSGSLRPMVTSAGGADPMSYGAAASAGYRAGHPTRPSSANPAYGRTPTFNSYGTSSGSSPPGASAGYSSGMTAYPATSGVAKHGGGVGHPRAAWSGGPTGGGGSSSGGYPQHQNYTVTCTSGPGGLPYMYRSVSATARTAQPPPLDDRDDGDDEPELVVEPDENGDVSRAVRQQLGDVADYCQARRHEIARLRTMPYA